MLTVKAIIRDGKLYFLDKVPFTGERRVLVTFLDEEARIATISKDKLDWMVDCIRNGGILLSKRQLEVLEFAKDGVSTTEIAKHLGVKDGSVRNQLSNIYRIIRMKNK